MKKFDAYIAAKNRQYGIINEEGEMNAAAPQAASVPDAPTAPQVDNSPTPAQGSSTEKPVYDKPYQDLAGLLYKALRMDFDELGPTLQQKILNLHPDKIISDEQGVAIFKEFENIANEAASGDMSNSDFGPGANKI